MKSNQVKFLLTLFGMTVFINLISQSYEISQETYKKYFPLESQSAKFMPTTDYVCIMPSNETDKKLLGEMVEHFKKKVISKLPAIPNQVCKVVTDKDALKMDLSGVNIYAFGSVEGNLWISDFMEKTKNFPIKISQDSIVADKSYVGNSLLLKALWCNPYDPQYSLVLYIPQKLDAARSVKYMNTSQYTIWKNKKIINSNGSYHFRDNKWYFSDKEDTLLWFRSRYNRKPNPLLLDKFFLERYPEEKHLEDCKIDSIDIPYDTIKIETINNKYDNIDDLAWLKPIANKYKIVAIGENHYQKNTYMLFERILFTLNSYDHFKTLILELPYSLTGYYNHYLNIVDEKNANDFYKKEIEKLHYNSLMKKIRQWNKSNPQKTINIGCSDVEHHLQRTAIDIIKPYLRIVGVKVDLDSVYRKSPYEYSEFAKDIIREGKLKDIKGKYPFLNPEYLESVVDNFRSTLDEKKYYREHKNSKERYKLMIRNLTDERFLGESIRRNKSILYGGKNHFVIRKSKSQHVRRYKRYDTEGYLLANKFKETKNKVYTIRINSLALCISDSIPKINPAYGFQMEPLLIKFYKNRTIKLNEPIVFPLPNDFERYIFKLSYEYPNIAFRLKDVKIDNIMEKYEGFERYRLNHKLYEVLDYDTYIAIPYSPIE